MKSFLELIKEKKKIVIGIAVVVVLIVAVVVIALRTRTSDSNVKKPVASETVAVTKKADKDKKDDKKKKKQAETAWDGVEVKEEGTKSADEKEVLYKRNKKGEIVTNKKGEKVTRKPSYAGEDEGWSPIVSPDDLKKNK